MSYQSVSTPATTLAIKAPDYYHRTGQRGKDKSLHDIKFNPDQYSILGERTLEYLKRRERAQIPDRGEIEKECMEVLMTLDTEFGLQAAHYEDQVMLEKALQKITAMAKDNDNLQELKAMLNRLVNQRKQLKEKEDAFLNTLSVFIDFYARADFELLMKGIVKPDFLANEFEQLHKLLAQKGKLDNDRKRFHFDLNSFLQQPAQPPTPPTPKLIEKPPSPPKRVMEEATCNLWNFEHPGLREWRANFFGPQFPYQTFTLEQLMVLLGQRATNPNIQVLPPLQHYNNENPNFSQMLGGMGSMGSGVKLEWPYVTALGHRFPRGATTEVEQIEYFKAMEADLLINLRKIPPFSGDYGVTAAHLNLVRHMLADFEKKKYHWIDYSHEIVTLPKQRIRPTKLIHNPSKPFEDLGNQLPLSVSQSVMDKPGQAAAMLYGGMPEIDISDIEGGHGFRFKLHGLKNLHARYRSQQLSLRGALFFGEEIFSDKNNQKCSFSTLISGQQSEIDDTKLRIRMKRDFDVDFRSIIGPSNTVFELEKFTLILNIFDNASQIVAWQSFPMYTSLRFNKGKFTRCLYAPPAQKPPASDPKIPLDLEMQHEIIPLPCPDSDDDDSKTFTSPSMMNLNKKQGGSQMNLRRKGDGVFDEDDDNTFESRTSQTNLRPGQLDFSQVKGIRLKLPTMLNFDTGKRGKVVSVRLALLSGTQVLRDKYGEQCADSRDLQGSDNFEVGKLNINYEHRFYLKEGWVNENSQNLNIVVNYFDSTATQIGWQVIPILKYRKFNQTPTTNFLFAPPALPPPFEGSKNPSNELYPIMTGEPEQKVLPALNMSAVQNNRMGQNNTNQIPSQQQSYMQQQQNMNSNQFNNNNNNNQLSSQRVDLTSQMSPPSNPQALAASQFQKTPVVNKTSTSTLPTKSLAPAPSRVPAAQKKLVIPNIADTDTAIQIAFKSVKNWDMTKGTNVRVSVSVLLGSGEIMVDDFGSRCEFSETITASAGKERNSIALTTTANFRLNPNKLAGDYDIKQLESIQALCRIDQGTTTVGWLLFPLFKYKKMNKGTFTNYMSEPPAQSPPFDLASMKNSKLRCEYVT